MNPTQIPRGPGKVSFFGVTPASGDITINFDSEAKPVATLQGGPNADHFQGNGMFTITFTPVATLATVAPWFNFVGALMLNQAIAPHAVAVASVSHSTEVLTMDRVHNIATGTAVRVAWGDGPAPALGSGSLSATTVYYARAVTTTTLSLHDTAQHATDNTDAVNFAAWTAGTDTPFWVTTDLPAVVHFADGTRFTFHNAGIAGLPGITGSATELHLDGTVTIRAFVKTGSDTDDTGAFYTRDRAAYTAPSAILGTRLTTPMIASWGSGNALQNMLSETGWKIAITPTLADVPCGTVGLASQMLTGMAITVTGKPQNVKSSDLETLFPLQGDTKGAGAPLPAEDMVVAATAGGETFSITIPKMTVTKRTLMASLQQQRVGDLEFVATGLSFDGSTFTIALS